MSNGLDPDQVRSDILLVLICAQTACKGQQQMSKVSASMERFKQNQKIEDVSALIF